MNFEITVKYTDRLLFKMIISEGLSKHICFLVYSSEFLDRNYKCDIIRQCLHWRCSIVLLSGLELGQQTAIVALVQPQGLLSSVVEVKVVLLL